MLGNHWSYRTLKMGIEADSVSGRTRLWKLGDQLLCVMQWSHPR